MGEGGGRLDELALALLVEELTNATTHVCKDGGGVTEQIVRADELVHLKGGLLRVRFHYAVGNHFARLEDVLQQHADKRTARDTRAMRSVQRAALRNARRC